MEVTKKKYDLVKICSMQNEPFARLLKNNTKTSLKQSLFLVYYGSEHTKKHPENGKAHSTVVSIIFLRMVVFFLDLISASSLKINS
jgi:hypothetical protein